MEAANLNVDSPYHSTRCRNTGNLEIITAFPFDVTACLMTHPPICCCITCRICLMDNAVINVSSVVAMPREPESLKSLVVTIRTYLQVLFRLGYLTMVWIHEIRWKCNKSSWVVGSNLTTYRHALGPPWRRKLI